MRVFKGSVLGILIGFGAVASAEIVLEQPIECTLGEDCVIQQFVDHDTSDGVQDFRCEGASYDGHKGTDFRISVSDMARGVDVLAAADGIVMGVRDGMADRRVTTDEDRSAVAGKECGNGLVLRHENGWETQYCHMKNGSVSGKKGNRVKAGDVLGQVGLSGRTQFPHIHLSVRKDGKPVDPFAPNFDAKTCRAGLGRSLWTDRFQTVFTYQPTKVVQLGVADTGPSLADVMDGKWDAFDLKSKAPLVVFGLAVNGKTGDQLVLRLTGPMGVIVETTRPPLDKRKAQWFGFAGKKAPLGGWPKGRYTISSRVMRDGQSLHNQTREYELK